MDTTFINDLAKKLASSVPDNVQSLRSDLEHNFRGLLAGVFERMDLVTREEFDVQRRVLERTREKLAELDAEVTRLEGGITGADSTDQPSG